MSRFDGLSPRLRRAAEFVAAHPDEVATRTLRQVAKAADLPPPTLSRLARALDCETYEELREICRGDIRRRSRILADKADALLRLNTGGPAAGRSGVFMAQAGAAVENVQQLIASVDLDKLRAAADTLTRARRVVLFGTSSGLALASYFTCMARIAFENWRVAGAEGALWAADLAKLGPGDAAFVVSVRPYGDSPVRAAEAVHQRGADLVAITDSMQSPYGGLATHCFIVGTECPQFFPSHVAVMVLIESLMGMIVRRGGEEAAGRVQEMESTAHALQEYWVN